MPSPGVPMDVLVVGNGVAGVTCAMELRKRDAAARITLISDEAPFFFSRTALMYAFMDRLQRRELEPFERRTWEEQRLELVQDRVVDVDASAHTITLRAGGTRRFDRLVLAVGARARTATWPGMDAVKDGVVNLVSMQDLDACERLAPSSKHAVVVGGGLIGIELVECLAHAGVETSFLVREPHYWPVALGAEESAMVVAQLKKHGVTVELQAAVDRVDVDAAGRVAAVQAGGKTYPCNMLGVCIGVEPNVAWLRGVKTPPALGRGVLVDGAFKTSLPDVWSCGDCAEIAQASGPRLLETIWYSAKRQGRLVAGSILGDSVAYTPPTFFNSSKLFELEFTTVGQVMDVPDGTPSILRRHPSKDASQRIVHDGTRVLGFNMLGSRWDHTLLSRWVEERQSPAWVLKNLHRAQFDVEFGRLPLAQCVETQVPIQRPRP